MHRSVVLMLAAAGALATTAPAQAGFITYTGTGTMRKAGLSTNDPWGIGTSATFTISVTLASDAADVNGNVALAHYSDFVSASFAINGVAAPSVGAISPGATVVGFSNNAGFNTRDIAFFQLNATVNGTTEKVYIEYHLPLTTFSLTNAVSALPVFADTAPAFSISNVTAGSSYSFSTSTESLLTVTTSDATAVPAPPGLVLVLSAAATGLGLRLRRR